MFRMVLLRSHGAGSASNLKARPACFVPRATEAWSPVGVAAEVANWLALETHGWMTRRARASSNGSKSRSLWKKWRPQGEPDKVATTNSEAFLVLGRHETSFCTGCRAVTAQRRRVPFEGLQPLLTDPHV